MFRSFFIIPWLWLMGRVFNLICRDMDSKVDVEDVLFCTIIRGVGGRVALV